MRRRRLTGPGSLRLFLGRGMSSTPDLLVRCEDKCVLELRQRQPQRKWQWQRWTRACLLVCGSSGCDGGWMSRRACCPTPSGRRSSLCSPLSAPGREGRGGIIGRWSRESSTATGAGLPGGTSRPTSGPGRRCGSATAPGPPTAPGTRSSTRSWLRADADGELDWSET